MLSIVFYALAAIHAVNALDLTTDNDASTRVYYPLAASQRTENFTVVTECSARPDSTSKKWTTSLDAANSGLNLLTLSDGSVQPSLTLVLSMDHWYHNVTCASCPIGPVGTATSTQCTSPCLTDGSANTINSPDFTYPNFCGSNLPDVKWRTSKAVQDVSSGNFHSCEYTYEVSMAYVEFCNFDVTDDAENYQFSGFMNVSVTLAQPFLSSVVFQSFKKPIGFSVRLPKTLTVTTDITVVNPNECDTSADCNGQVCEARDGNPRKCFCDFCHSGQFCGTDTCNPRIECPADITLNGCTRNNGYISDSASNLIAFGSQVFKATDTWQLDPATNDYATVVGATGTSLQFEYSLDGSVWTAITETSTATSPTGGANFDAQVSFDLATQNGLWTLGSNSVQFRVKDNDSASSACTVQVTVNDVCVPTITCGALFITNDYTQIDAQFNPSTTTKITFADGLNTSPTLTRTQAIGTYTQSTQDGLIALQFCVSDGVTTAQCCTQNVNLDTTPPVINCEDYTLDTDDYQNYATATIPEPTRSDPGNNPSGLKANTYTESPANVVGVSKQWSFGTNFAAVTFSVEDNAGNQGTCTTDVVVNDPLDPKVVCTDQVVDVPANGNTYVFTQYLTSQATTDTTYLFTTHDNVNLDATERVWAGKPVGNVFPLGVTTITLTEFDHVGNSVTVSCTVTVKDPHAPTLAACPTASVSRSMLQDKDYDDIRTHLKNIVATAADNNAVDASRTEVTIGTSTVNLYSALDTVDSTSFRLVNEGSFTATIKVYDQAILTYAANSYTCTITYQVADYQAPVIVCPANIEVNVALDSSTYSFTSWNLWVPAISSWGSDNYGMATVSYDTASFSPAATSVDPVVLNVGENVQTVQVTVYDIATVANTDFCSFSVTVKDPHPPVLTCEDITISGVSGTNLNGPYGTISNADFTYTASDNVALDGSVHFDYSVNNQFPLGSTSVTGIVYDTSRNYITCTFTVTVEQTCGDGYRGTGEICDGEPFCTSTCVCDGTTYVYDATVDRCVVPCTTSTCVVEDACALELRDWTNTAPSAAAAGNYPLIWQDPSSHWDTTTLDTTANAYFFTVDQTFEWYPYNTAACEDPTLETKTIVLSASSPSTLDMRVGDTFKLEITAGEVHTIFRMPDLAAYESCDFASATQVASPVEFIPSEVGAVFFASQESCSNGYKVHFDVRAAPPSLAECVSTTAASLQSGEYFEAKICCTAMPAHELSAIVFSDTSDETSYSEVLGDCASKGNTGLSIRAGAAGTGDAGCWYVPICSPGVVKVGLKEPDTYDTVACVVPQTAVSVDMTTGSCATVTYSLDNRYTVTQGDISVTWDTVVATGSYASGACVPANEVVAGVASPYTVSFYVRNGTAATDASITCQFELTVNDKVNPTFVNCPTDSSVNMDAGTSYATYTPPTIQYRDETSPKTDTTVSTAPTTSPAVGALESGQYRLSGATTFSQTVYDHNANPATCTWTVTPVDNQAPSLTCPDQTYEAVTGTNSYDFGSLTIACSDNVDGDCSFSQAIGVKSVIYFEDGANQIAYTASYTDAAGQQGTCSGTLIVTSNQNPQITCPADISVDLPADSCDYSKSFDETDFTFGDNDGENRAGYSDAQSACYNNADCLMSLKLSIDSTEHTQFPVAYDSSAPGQASVEATVEERKVPGALTKRSHACTFTVTTVDVTKPTLTCATSAPALELTPACISAGSCTDTTLTPTTAQLDALKSAIATTYDACNSNIVVNLPQTIAAFNIGSNNILSLTASIVNGYGPTTSDAVNCPVEVKDKVPPSKTTCPTNTEILLSEYRTNNPGASRVDYSFTVGTDVEYTDNYDASVTYKNAADDSDVATGAVSELDLQPSVVHTYRYKACDQAGNCGPECTWTVTLKDDVAPELTCPTSEDFEVTGAHPAYTTYSWTASATDSYFNLASLTWSLNNNAITAVTAGQVGQSNVGLPLSASAAIVVNSASPYDLGASTFTLSVTKATNGQSYTSSCTWTVKLKDTTPPSIDCNGVTDMRVRANDNNQVTVTYPASKIDAITASDLHDSTPALSYVPTANTVLNYVDGGDNDYDVTFTAIDDMTSPTLQSTSTCFKFIVLKPYPNQDVLAALTRVRVLYDEATDSFSSEIEFLSGSRWPYTIHKSTVNPSISEPGATSASSVTSFESTNAQSPQLHCYTALGAHTGTDESFVCFQNWRLLIAFGSCDPTDMAITVPMQAECDQFAAGQDDCTKSFPVQFQLTFAAESYCEQTLRPVTPTGSLKVFSAVDTAYTGWTAPGLPTVVVETDIPDPSLAYNAGDSLVALFSVWDDDVLIESISYLSLTRKACADTSYLLCDCLGDRAGDVDGSGICPYGQSTIYSSTATGAQAGTAASVQNNFAYVQYTESNAAPQVTVQVQLVGTVAVSYRLSAGGIRRRSVLSYEMMRALAPAHLAPLLPTPRRGLLQAGDLLETSSTASVGLSFGNVGSGSGSGTGTGTGSSSQQAAKMAAIPVWVWVLVVGTVIVCVCGACVMLSCVMLSSMKKKGELKDVELETQEMELAHTAASADTVTNIYLSPQVSGTRNL